MNCTACGGEMKRITTDLPFKIAQTSIVVMKDVPVLQCVCCEQFLIEDAVMGRVDRILAGVGANAELEVVRFAA